MTHSSTVRIATPGDAIALHALRLALFEETDRMLWEPGEYRATVEDEARQLDLLRSQPRSTCLVAEQEGRLVGFLNAFGGHVNRRRHSATLALGVLRSHWGRGLGTCLVTEAINWSRTVELTRIELTVHTTNLPALAVYLKAGFEVEGMRRKSLHVGGAYVDEYQMSLINEV